MATRHDQVTHISKLYAFGIERTDQEDRSHM